MEKAPHAAVVTREDGSLTESYEHTISRCSEEAVLIRVSSVALNPSDYKVPAVVKQAGLVSGCDFAGEIVEVGTEANSLLGDSREPWKIGDRVCGAVLGANQNKPSCGAFAQFVEADPLVLIRIPPSWDWASAAALGGSCIGAVGQALFVELQLSLDELKHGINSGREPLDFGVPGIPPLLSKGDLEKIVLVYGGSTACGTVAIQILRLAGYIPITTCSPRNQALVTSYGAVAAFDYGLSSCAQDIKAYTKGTLAFVVDCIATVQSATLCYGAMSRGGGRYVSLERFPESVSATRRVIKASWVMGPLMLGGAIDIGTYRFEPDLSAREFARTWFALVQQMLHNGRIKPHPVSMFTGGNDWMRVVISKLASLAEGKVSGQKLVVSIEDTGVTSDE